MASNEERILMKVTAQGGFGNTSIVGTLTMRRAITLVVVVLLGFLLLRTPLFAWNYFAIGAYIALVSLCLGSTPTGRNIIVHLYGILFRKPVNMLVSDDMTVATIGHGIKEAVLDEKKADVIPIRMVGTKNYALVYHITSDIGRWSTEDNKIRQARTLKNLYNILEGGESLVIVAKQDNDTGMLKLKEALNDMEIIEGDDMQMMSNTRQQLLQNAGTSAGGRSIQQYAIVLVKPKNIARVSREIQKIARIASPAPRPLDVLFATMGFEGGVEWAPKGKEISREDKTKNKHTTI